jgi:prepilin-type N-terminal cleavage/methylation domain-containing protein
MKGNKGFTLIELAVVLAIIAILAAILTPLVTSYIEESRVTRAATDARAIAQAFRLHFRDTAKYPIFETSTDTIAVEPVLVSAGNFPAVGSSGWDVTTTASINTYLNENQLGLDTSGNFTGGRVAYRGPYLETIVSDPWGNAFLINATDLESGDTNLGYVISAGPDGVLDTGVAQTAAFSAAGDDIVFRIE